MTSLGVWPLRIWKSATLPTSFGALTATHTVEPSLNRAPSS